MANNLLINVSVMGASSNSEILATIDRNLSAVENSAFKVATRCAYLIGVEVPTENGEKIKNPKAMERKDVYAKVKKSKATLSRWVKALNYVIDNQLFNDFNNGVYPFSFDKIIIIFDHELTADNTFENLMAMSVAELEKLYKAEAEAEAEETAEAEAEVEAEEIAEDNSPLVTFEYGGKKYTVHENTMVAFIEQYCEMA